MKSPNISLKAELDSRSGVADLLKSPGDAVLITRGKPRWLLLRCPCGCGEEIPVNLDARAGKAWRLYREPTTGFTLFPSVWRDTGCMSHFVIWRDRILMFGPGRISDNSPRGSIDLRTLSKRVLDAWPRDRLVPYVEVADVLREIPWDVQEACRDLVEDGSLVEGTGERRGSFLRIAAASRRD
jgi:hypothetical protein